MLRNTLTFDAPWYLLLLVLVPLLWGHGFRRLAVLGRGRRLFALALRGLVVMLVVMALAGAQAVRVSHRLTVLYLLDRSASIPADRQRPMIDYVNAAVQKQRAGADRAGVLVFARDAAIEVPPFDESVPLSPAIESPLDPNYTNLAAAMRLAQASFSEDAAKRIVIVSDGNQNLGEAAEQGRALALAGVGIDVVPVRYSRRGEIAVERLVLPGNIRRGQPFDLKVVINNIREPAAGDPGVVGGRLTIRKRLGEQSEVIVDDPVKLPPGKRVFTVRQQMDAAGFYTYEAAFTPARPEDDTFPQNNRATAFAHVRGKGQVLLIEDFDNPGEHERLLQALRRENLEVSVRRSNQPFADLTELQPFDTVILGNVPREHFTDDQIQMLVRNTQQLGSGLIMLGGPNSFGAGGWNNTPLEAAMPVDFQIKAAKVIPQGALAILMHASEMAQGNYWQKVIAEEAIKTLGPRDYCGVQHFDWSGAQGVAWLWDPAMATVGDNREAMLAAVSKMAPGDMPDFEPALAKAAAAFQKIPSAAVKHMIVISDGDPAAPSSSTVRRMVAMQVTVTTVAIGAHGSAESDRLARLAADTAGKYYRVNDPSQLPRIFQREARRVAQPLVYESTRGFRPLLFSTAHEMVSGLGALPPIHGYVMTSRKENPLVELSILAPEPSLEKNNTILASWTYGLGKTVAFTTDAGARWATAWTRWENYDKFFGQMVRWSMRPAGDDDRFILSTDAGDGQVRVVVNALDKNDEFVNFLGMAGMIIGPDLKSHELKMEQTGPGRYVGTFPAIDAGSYFVAVSPGAGKAMLRTGVNVPYSDEFRARSANQGLLDQLAGLTPSGGRPGRVIDAPANLDDLPGLLTVNTFRHDLQEATSSQDIWHFLALSAACLFFADVFVRRVHVSFAWAPRLAGRLWDRLLRRPPPAPAVETIQRLRGRKAEVAERLEQLRASTRFVPPEPAGGPGPTPADSLDQPSPLLPAGPSAPAPAAPALQAQPPAEEGYTARLLKAKRKVWEKKDGG
jgi:uncharacterized membrane protein